MKDSTLDFLNINKPNTSVLVLTEIDPKRQHSSFYSGPVMTVIIYELNITISSAGPIRYSIRDEIIERSDGREDLLQEFINLGVTTDEILLEERIVISNNSWWEVKIGNRTYISENTYLSEVIEEIMEGDTI